MLRRKPSMFVFDRAHLVIATVATISTITICATTGGAHEARVPIQSFGIHFGPGPNFHTQSLTERNLVRFETAVQARQNQRDVNLASLRALELESIHADRQVLSPTLAVLNREQREQTPLLLREQVREEIFAGRAAQVATRRELKGPLVPLTKGKAGEETLEELK